MRLVTPASQPAPRLPVICLHGNPQSARAYDRVLANLGADRLGIAIDTPGCGLSDPAPGRVSLEAYAGAMTPVPDALGVREIDLIGTFTGSRLAVAWAELQPQRVRRLILIGAPVYTDAERENAQRSYEIPVAVRGGMHLTDSWCSFVDEYPPDENFDEVNDQFCDSMLRVAKQERLWIVRANGQYRYEEHIGRLRHPILVLNPTGPLHRATERIRAYLTNGRVEALTFGGATLLISHAEEITARIRAFLDT